MNRVSSKTETFARLQILETTDLHMQILDYDYFSDRKDDHSGLVRLLGHINRYRNTRGQTCLLFDNGDFIQGNPLADYLATQDDDGGVHPMIAAFNALGYDAITLGNHELDYGLPFLRKALEAANFPVTCANIRDTHDPPLAQEFCILDREMVCDDGQSRPIRIGVIGFLPPQVTQWDRDALRGKVTTEDIVNCAKRVVPQIKAAGADLVIALCHSGIGSREHTVNMENAALPLAAVGGIDVLLTGHTHDMFPDGSRDTGEGADAVAGTLLGKPAVMAGFYGNRLGVIDLDLVWNDAGWHIAGNRVGLQKGSATTAQSQLLRDKVSAGLQKAHRATLAHIRQPIAVTHQHMHSYFATILPDLGQKLLAQAQVAHVRQALKHGEHKDTPVLAVTSPFRFGDRAGPGHYIDVPPGAVTLRDAAAIYPFANALCGVKRTGADIRAWLERAAAHFQQLAPGVHDQPLIRADSPGYDYDTLFGLDYEIDLGRPARYDTAGQIQDAHATRVQNLSWNGQPVRGDDIFILATNSYRALGGGNYPKIPERDIIYHSTRSTRDILIAYLAEQSAITAISSPVPQFTHLPDTCATFLSSPAARQHMTDRMRHLGPGPDGFHRYQLIL